VGVGRLVSLGLSSVAVIKIDVSRDLKVARMRQRGDTENMIEQRLQFDDADRLTFDPGNLPVLALDAAEELGQKSGCED
jgi:dephospho-CoA kinase